MFANSQPSALNFKSFSRLLEQFFLIVSQNNFGNKIPIIHARTIEDNKHRHRSFMGTEHFTYGCATRNRTEETEMTSREVMEFEKDWKKLWHPKMTQGESINL